MSREGILMALGIGIGIIVVINLLALILGMIIHL
tara:strand:+ start:16537 stop:16638 length:102 start_codon:yes stop_codon:yes gene_type:complete